MAGAECSVPAPACEHESKGFEEQIGPFFSYVSIPPVAPKAALLLVSDILGFDTPLLRKLADKIAALGYLVTVPDFFQKDPFKRDAGVALADWLKNHQPMDAVEGAKNVVEILKSRGLPSVAAVGFCWGGIRASLYKAKGCLSICRRTMTREGGSACFSVLKCFFLGLWAAKVAVELAKEDHLKAVILCHPSFVTVEDIQDVKTPIAILAAELDTITPSALVTQFSKILESKEEVQSFVKIYPGATHGWVIRYDVNDANAVESAEEAHQKIIEWLEAFLP